MRLTGYGMTKLDSISLLLLSLAYLTLLLVKKEKLSGHDPKLSTIIALCDNVVHASYE